MSSTTQAPRRFARRALGIVAITASLLTALVSTSVPRADALNTFDIELLSMLNDYRTSLGMAPLEEHAPFSGAASTWAATVRAQGDGRSCNVDGPQRDTVDNVIANGAPAGTMEVFDYFKPMCGLVGNNFTFRQTDEPFPMCREPRDFTTSVDMFCAIVQDVAAHAALIDPKFTHVGLGSEVNTENRSLGKVSSQIFTSMRLASALPCLGLPITIDMNTNGGNGEGTPGDDVILGTPGVDIINAGEGNDTVCAGGGNDVIEAGPGDDLIYGSDGADKIFGRTGNDVIYGGTGNDTIHGNKGSDTLHGDSGADKIFGYADADVITGGAGDDRLHGNFGDDNIAGGDGNDRIFGYGDNDTLHGDGGNDLITGNFGDDTINGGEGNDTLFGSDGNDTLFGANGDDNLSGNSLDDILNGGMGDDALDGGIGSDSCNGSFGTDTGRRCEDVVSVP